MATFSVVVVTAPPPGQEHESSGPYVKVDGREALLRSVELFLNRDAVTQVQVVVDAAEAEGARRKFGGHLSFSGVKLLTAAGGSGGGWAGQLAAAAAALADDATHVIVHDAARPCVPYTDLEAVMGAAEQHPAVALAAPLKANLVELDDDGDPIATHPPTWFVQLLTPQAFARATFLSAAAARQDVDPAQFKLVRGSGLNVRVGTGADAGLAKACLGMLPKPKLKAPISPFEEAQW